MTNLRPTWVRDDEAFHRMLDAMMLDSEIASQSTDKKQRVLGRCRVAIEVQLVTWLREEIKTGTQTEAIFYALSSVLAPHMGAFAELTIAPDKLERAPEIMGRYFSRALKGALAA